MAIERIEKRSNQVSDSEQIAACLVTIRALVEDAYLTFESAYGQTDRNLERIDFEVTFMTRSFSDPYLTIAAAANKDNRAPKSLQLRQQQPDIYERTVSADLYRAPSPRITIIPSTSTVPYNELYPDQKRRIKSSVVLPVLTPSYALLGTLVVHCDREGFFRADKEKYLSDLLEIFAKRVAREVTLIVGAVKASSGALKPY